MRIASRRRPRLRLLAVLCLIGVPGASAPLVAVVAPVPGDRGPAGALPAAYVPTGPCRAAELIAGAPYAASGGRSRAGAVAVRYGDAAAPVLLAQAPPEPGAGFGAALAVGDFDRDRCADLAVGVPDRVFGTRRPGAEGHGAVRIYLGSPSGLRADRILSAADLGRPHGTDRFGAALAAADLDGDRDDELVVGAPGMDGGGGVAVFGLKGRGLRPGPVVGQGTSWVGQSPAETDGFGAVLAAGDLDGDDAAEIAVGAPGDGPKSQGSVTVLDPVARTADYVSQDEPGVGGSRERLDHFGSALATGDFDGDGRDELAIGVPGEEGDEGASTGYSEGAVQVLDGGSLRQTGRTWTGRGHEGPYDRFGAALASGDLTGDGTDDLAVGAPGRSAVTVLRGRDGSGLTGRRAATIGSPLGPDGQFGWSLAVRRGGLLIGAPGAAGYGGAVASFGGAASARAASTPAASAPATAVVPLTVRGLLGYSFG
ncbi:FG-GAP repeat protein [Spirillospora sp. CA-255316]